MKRRSFVISLTLAICVQRSKVGKIFCALYFFVMLKIDMYTLKDFDNKDAELIKRVFVIKNGKPVFQR